VDGLIAVCQDARKRQTQPEVAGPIVSVLRRACPAFFWRPRLNAAHCVASFRASFTMKAKIVITPKKAVVDPQGKSVQNALAHIGYTGVGAVHVGKYLEIELTGGDAETARKQIDDACHKFLSNPVIEDYRFEIEP